MRAQKDLVVCFSPLQSHVPHIFQWFAIAFAAAGNVAGYASGWWGRCVSAYSLLTPSTTQSLLLFCNAIYGIRVDSFRSQRDHLPRSTEIEEISAVLVLTFGCGGFTHGVSVVIYLIANAEFRHESWIFCTLLFECSGTGMPSHHRFQHGAQETTVSCGFVFRARCYRICDVTENLPKWNDNESVVSGGVSQIFQFESNIQIYTYAIIAQQRWKIRRFQCVNGMNEFCTINCIECGKCTPEN